MYNRVTAIYRDTLISVYPNIRQGEEPESLQQKVYDLTRHFSKVRTCGGKTYVSRVKRSAAHALILVSRRD